MGRGPLPDDLDLAGAAADAGAAATGWAVLTWDRGEELGNFSPVSPVPMATMTTRQPIPNSIPFRT
jgi:hypothetical protein